MRRKELRRGQVLDQVKDTVMVYGVFKISFLVCFIFATCSSHTKQHEDPLALQVEV